MLCDSTAPFKHVRRNFSTIGEVYRKFWRSEVLCNFTKILKNVRLHESGLLVHVNAVTPRQRPCSLTCDRIDLLKHSVQHHIKITMIGSKLRITFHEFITPWAVKEPDTRKRCTVTFVQRVVRSATTQTKSFVHIAISATLIFV